MTRYCVIGAGAAGISALQQLRSAGYEVDCYEKTDRVGGHWHTDYDALHLITSRDTTLFEDFPMPAELPPLPAPRRGARLHRVVRPRARALRDHPVRHRGRVGRADRDRSSGRVGRMDGHPEHGRAHRLRRGVRRERAPVGSVRAGRARHVHRPADPLGLVPQHRRPRGRARARRRGGELRLRPGRRCGAASVRRRHRDPRGRALPAEGLLRGAAPAGAVPRRSSRRRSRT